MLKRFVDFFRDPPPAQAPAPSAPQPQQAAQPHQAAVPPAQAPPPAAADTAPLLDHADPRFALDAAGQQRLKALGHNERQDLVAAFKQPQDYINARGLTLQHLMDLPDDHRQDLLQASQRFGALQQDDRTAILQTLDDPHSFTSLAGMDVRDIMRFPDKERAMLVRASNDLSAATQGRWTAGPRSDQDAQALSQRFFDRPMLHSYATIGFSNQVPLNEAMRFQHVCTNALKQGMDVPNVADDVDLRTLSHMPRSQADPIRHELRNSPIKQVLLAAQTFGTTLGVENTMVGRGGDLSDQQRAQAPEQQKPTAAPSHAK